MSDEEKIDIVRSFIKTCDSYDGEISIKTDGLTKCAIESLLTLIEKQSKEIEELKEKCKSMIDPSKARLTYNKGGAMVVLEGFISKKESEEKEKQAYIDGTNAADKLCNKKWEDKIKAKIEPRLKELDEQMKKEWKEYGNSREYQDMEDEWNFLQSLLEKE